MATSKPNPPQGSNVPRVKSLRPTPQVVSPGTDAEAVPATGLRKYLPKWLGGGPQLPRKPKSKLREWLDALVFAAVVALIVRTFILQPFVIPTSSMERSMMVGDYLFVSMFHYGARMPMVPLSVPFLHNRLPGGKVKSYVTWILLPYWRLPALQDVERNDPVVFNYPAEDYFNATMFGVQNGELRYLPASVKENYVKRCVAVPGDQLEVRNKQVYINGKPGQNPEGLQMRYRVYTSGAGFTDPEWLAAQGFRPEGNLNSNFRYDPYCRCFIISLDEERLQLLKNLDFVVKIELDAAPAGLPDPVTWPWDTTNFKWNNDNFGPVKLPKRGDVIQLTSQNLPLYRQIIVAYERHTLEVRGADIYIDGVKTNQYAIERDYYFMMGDNRDNSQDSRYWGFVPDDHIVGKPLFVFFSSENGIRWSRFFKGLN